MAHIDLLDETDESLSHTISMSMMSLTSSGDDNTINTTDSSITGHANTRLHDTPGAQADKLNSPKRDYVESNVLSTHSDSLRASASSSPSSTLTGQNNSISHTTSNRFVLLLCISGFFLSLKPSEPFLTPFLTQDKGVTDQELNDDIYPVWTYSYFACLLPVGVLAELFGYRIMIVAGIVAREVTRVLLLYSNGLQAMQWMQFAFGFASATDMVFYSFVYQMVSRDRYHDVTGYSRAAILVGHTLAGFGGQLLVEWNVSLRALFYISFATVSVGLVVFLAAPHPDHSSVHNQNSSSTQDYDYQSLNSLQYEQSSRTLRATLRRIPQLGARMLDTYLQQNCAVLFLSMWWWGGYAVLELVLNYATTLFDVIDSSVDYNGAVTATGRLFAAAASLLAAPIAFWVIKNRFLVLAFGSILSAALLSIAAETPSIIIAYMCFAVFYGCMSFLVACVSAHIATHANGHELALIFACNTCVALAVQTLGQLAIGKHWLHLTVRAKFIAFALQLVLVALLYVGLQVYSQCTRRPSDKDLVVPTNPVHVQSINQ
jgi:solute carrier family 19 (thiamine transporter), member 2/3